MAARFWRSWLLLGLICASALAAIVGSILSLTVMTSVVIAALIWVTSPGLLVCASFLLARYVSRGKQSHPGCAEWLYVICRETAAFMRATVSMSREPIRGPTPEAMANTPGNTEDASACRPVLLVHGVLCNRGVWRPFARALAAHGFGPIRAVSLEPLLAGLDSQAAQLAGEMQRLRRECRGAPVVIIAHSMGGLVARAALRLTACEGISQLITLASPHYGSELAGLLHMTPFTQMRPRSAWLNELNAAQEARLTLPVTCLYSDSDNLIRPADSAALKGARLIELRGLGHMSLLSDRESIDCTLSALLGSTREDGANA